MPTPPDRELSIIIVTWNCEAEVVHCLQSLQCQVDTTREIILVDNASSDATVETVRRRFASVDVITVTENVGFGRAANLGLASSRGSFVLFLNPDTTVPAGQLDAALDALRRRPEIGVLGVRLLGAEGRPQGSCGRFLSLRGLVRANVLRAIGMRPERGAGGGRLWSGSRREEVEWVAGAFLLCRREALDSIAGFDERYFLYVEDIDLCYRIRRRGYRVMFDPDVAIVHYGNRSGARRWGERREGEIVRSEILFMRTHRGMVAALTFRVLAGVWFAMKAVTCSLRARDPDERQCVRSRYWYMTKVCAGWK